MTHGRYHPVTQAKMVGAFDANNNLTALHMRISGQSILAFVNPQNLQNGKDLFVFQGLNPGGTEGAFGYTIPNLRIDHAMRNPHIPPHFWRGVNNNHNAVYLECFMDELAHAAGQDPLEFCGKLMANHPKHLAMLNAVAERAGWGKPATQGSTAASPSIWATAATSLPAPRSRSTRAPSRSTASSLRPVQAVRSIRRRSNGRSRVLHLRAIRAFSTRSAP
jgi:CO/xanthine dehydrogenase Mo-binding subunit